MRRLAISTMFILAALAAFLLVVGIIAGAAGLAHGFALVIAGAGFLYVSAEIADSIDYM